MVEVLIVAPHPDDAELNMGGAILKMRAEGLRVGVVDLTNGEPTPHGTEEIRRRETEAATEVLRLDWRACLELPNRSLQPSLDARRALAGVFRLQRPKVVFAPHWEDAHPDHVAASQLADAARFWAKLTRTDMPGEPHWPQRMFYHFSMHLRSSPKPAFVVDISEHWETKLRAVACYQSQFVAGQPTGPPTFLDQVRERAAYWGWTIGSRYGEPFASREELGVRTVSGFF